MKKFLIILLLLTLLLSTYGCNKKEEPFLEYQNGDFEAKGSLNVNGGKYSVSIAKKDDVYNLNFLSPDSMKGVGIEKNKDGIFYKVGSLTLPITDGMNASAKLPELFTLTKDDLVSTHTDTVNGTKVQIARFNKNELEIKLILSKETSLPLRFEAVTNGTVVIFNVSEFNNLPTFF
jgi:hypothetical protein